MRALITGVTGQDGYYLSEHLNNLGYDVYGGYRRSSNMELPPNVDPVYMEMGEYESVVQAIKSTRPDEIYNLAAQSHVGESFKCPLYTEDINSRGLLRVLESVRGNKTRVYQASTSEMFGGGRNLNEDSPFNPKSPYAISKVSAHHFCKMYRRAYSVGVSTGILFNHESPRRGKDFVTRKVCIAAAHDRPLELGNLNARRDWGHARDYVEAMHLMLQNEPDDFVICTGKSHSIRELIDEAYSHVIWKPNILNSTREKRPWDVDVLEGDASKALDKLGWRPKYGFKALIKEMVFSERESIRSSS